MLRGQGTEGKEPCGSLWVGAAGVSRAPAGARRGAVAWPARVARWRVGDESEAAADEAAS
jgi:hypothetical protein